jgi:hypothetical protein
MEPNGDMAFPYLYIPSIPFLNSIRGIPYPCQLSDRKGSRNRYGGMEIPCHYRLPYLDGVENIEKVWKMS